MKKYGFFVIILCILGGAIQSQKRDRNWAFGIGGGINFKDTSNITTFWTQTSNLEVAASISDTGGNLLFYVGRRSGGVNIYNKDNNIIINGDSINCNITVTNGVLIVPHPTNDSIFFLFHHDIYNWTSCPYYFCDGLFYSVIGLNELGNLHVIKKNVFISNETLSDKLSAVRHANGIDWWIIVQAAQKGNLFPCINRFYIYLLENDSVRLHSVQDIGSPLCNESSYWGEMTFNKLGTQLALVIGSQGTIDLFDFDRCNGTLSNFQIVDQQSGLYPYGCEFSPKGDFLYVSSGADIQQGRLYQYNLNNRSRTILWADTMGAYVSTPKNRTG